MTEVIGTILPLAVGVVVSPLPVVALVILLLGSGGRRNGLAFTSGWVAGIALLGAVAIALAGTLEARSAPPWRAWLQLLLGAALLWLAVRSWRSRSRPTSTPKWMTALDAITPLRAAGLGTALGVANPKNLALAVTAATAVAGGLDGSGARALAWTFFTLVASAGLIVPLASYVLAGKRAEDMLRQVQGWMLDNNAAITTVILLVFAAKLVGQGLTAL